MLIIKIKWGQHKLYPGFLCIMKWKNKKEIHIFSHINIQFPDSEAMWIMLGIVLLLLLPFLIGFVLR